jgi:capsule polysaccharide export protein KpsE/RkpR
MSKKASASDDFNSLNVLFFVYKWRKQLTIVGVSAFIISSIVALTIQERFKSTVILFPATTNSISKALLTDNSTTKEDILQFGEEEEAEQMLQILNSDEVRTRICEKYNLQEHYGIDPDDRYKRTKLYDEYLENINFKRTEYMSVKIEVMDYSADTAAMIANDIAALHDSTKIRMQHERAREALRIVEREYFLKSKEIKVMEDSLKVINGYGVFDYESQSEVTSEQYAIAIAKNDQRAVKSLEEKLQVIGKYGSAYVSLRDNMYMQRKQLNLLKSKYDEAKVDAEQVLSQKFVVSNAYPAEKKSYPIRWLIVVVSVLSALLIAVVTILIVENIRQFRIR